jgi:hypothetical protein
MPSSLCFFECRASPAWAYVKSPELVYIYIRNLPGKHKHLATHLPSKLARLLVVSEGGLRVRSGLV